MRNGGENWGRSTQRLRLGDRFLIENDVGSRCKEDPVHAARGKGRHDKFADVRGFMPAPCERVVGGRQLGCHALGLLLGPRARSRGQLYIDYLALRELPQTLVPHFRAETRLLCSPNGHIGGQIKMLVDPHDSSLELESDRLSSPTSVVS